MPNRPHASPAAPAALLALVCTLLVLAPPERARAASPDPAAAADSAARAPEAEASRFPTGRQRLLDWANNACGPFALAGDATSAAWGQWVIDEPPEWDADGRGFAQRFGVAAATTVITETSFSALSALCREDVHYYRSARGGLGSRIAHAVKLTVCARRRDGREVFSVARTISPFVGPMVTRNTLYPDRYGPGDGATSGAYALLMNLGWNLAYEFVLKPKRW